MDVVEKCVDLLSQAELKDYDIKVLKKVLNWKQRDNEDLIALKDQIKHSVGYYDVRPMLLPSPCKDFLWLPELLNTNRKSGL